MQLVISDAHTGLKAAIGGLYRRMLATVPRHFMRNVLAIVPKGNLAPEPSAGTSHSVAFRVAGRACCTSSLKPISAPLVRSL